MESLIEAENVQLTLLLALDAIEKEPHITLLVDAGSVNGRGFAARSLLSMRGRGLVRFALRIGEQAIAVGDEATADKAGEKWIGAWPVALTEPGRALARDVVAELAAFRPIESSRTKLEPTGPIDPAR